MITVVPAAQRHFRDAGWLQTYWLFSFDDYYDPANVQWGALRVFNDDVVAPGRGFPLHPHRDAEVVTMPLSGALTHRDDMGNEGTIRPGEVQRMTAGRGVRHSEMNEGTEPVHLYQVWFLPSEQGLPPSYEQRAFDPAAWRGQLLAVASGQGHPGAVLVHADVAMYRADLAAGQALDYPTAPGRHLFIYLTDGRLAVNGEPLQAGDQARITHEHTLRLETGEGCGLVLIEA